MPNILITMSNIAKKPIKIDQEATVVVNDRKVTASGPKGSLEMEIPQGIGVIVEDGVIKINKNSDLKDLDKFAGLTRALIANIVEGVVRGFSKQLELSGVGYRAKVEGQELILNVGYSVPVRVVPVEGVSISVEENIITVAGMSKQLVGDTASQIRKIRPPDPYKGKGIKYVGEKLRRKAGKAAKAAGAATK